MKIEVKLLAIGTIWRQENAQMQDLQHVRVTFPALLQEYLRQNGQIKCTDVPFIKEGLRGFRSFADLVAEAIELRFLGEVQRMYTLFGARNGSIANCTLLERESASMLQYIDRNIRYPATASYLPVLLSIEWT